MYSIGKKVDKGQKDLLGKLCKPLKNAKVEAGLRNLSLKFAPKGTFGR